MALLAAGVTAVQCRKPTELRTTSDCLTLVDCICAKKDRPICTGAVFFSCGCYLLNQMIQACQYQFVSPDIIEVGDGMGGVAHRVPHDEITPHIQEQKVVIESFGF